MPAGQGKDAERFAAAVEQGRSPGSADAELARDLEIVSMLRSAGAAYAPDPAAKARAKQRLMAVLAAEGGARPSASEMTLPIMGSGISTTPRDRVNPLRDEHPGEITARIAPVPAHDEPGEVVPADEPDDEPAADAEYPATPVRPVVTGARAVGRSRKPGRHTLPSRPSRSGSSARPGKRSVLRRAVMAGSAAMLALVALAGTSAFASRNALPGDGLYGVKRAAETAGLALTFDDAARASRHLELASTRLAEVEQMVDRPSSTPADPQLVHAAISDFDLSTGEGSKLFLTDEVAHDAARLADLQAWAAEQISRISALRSGLPEPAQAEADASIALLDRLMSRAAALENRSGCSDVTSGSDELGPLPASTPCTTGSAGADQSDRSGSTTARRSGSTTTEEPSGSATPSAGPSGSATPTPSGDGLLPNVLDGTRTSTSSPSATDDGERSTPSSAAPTSVSVPLPLPLLPPITLPPLLPGAPSITIG